MEQNMNMGTPMPEEKTSTGSIIGIIVIVLVLAFGAYYFFKQVPMPAENEVLSPSEVAGDTSLSGLTTQGTSTELGDIQKDLDATNLTGLDAGLSDIAI